ncbi:MAG: DUF6516 family protein [Halobacteria archaeon]|nr:DUF6516 family protein [Halobacteria archaeon]
MAEKIAQRTLNIGGIRVEAIAWKVQSSGEFPEGIKYRFQALDEENNHVERWDNTNDTHGPRHHKHLADGTIEEIEEPPENRDDIKELLREFINEVTKK